MHGNVIVKFRQFIIWMEAINVSEIVSYAHGMCE